MVLLQVVLSQDKFTPSCTAVVLKISTPAFQTKWYWQLAVSADPDQTADLVLHCLPF